METQSIRSSLFRSAERGDRSAADTLFDAPHFELHRIVNCELARRRIAVRLGATTHIETKEREGI